MRSRHRTGVPLTLLALLCAAGTVQGAETRTPTPEEVREVLRRASETGSVPVQRPPARQTARQTAPAKPPQAVEQYNKAVTIHTGKSPSASELKEAAALYQAALDGGVPEAGVNLALMYQDGTGVKKDLKKTLALLNAASKKGVSQADVMLARLYLLGSGVKADGKKGEELLKKAVRAGNQNAGKMLAEYREWKKKSTQFTYQLKEVSKGDGTAPFSLTPQPQSSIPPGFPVIPGQAYLEKQRPFAPVLPPVAAQPREIVITPPGQKAPAAASGDRKPETP